MAAAVLATLLALGGCAAPGGDGNVASFDLRTATTAEAEPTPEASASSAAAPSEPEPSAPAATASAVSDPVEKETDAKSAAGDEPSDQPSDDTSAASSSGEAKPAHPVTVTHVVDGDTVYTSDGGKIRLIGYDTPERGECGFDDAKAFVATLVLDQQVELINPSSVDDSDKYDRLLRYVSVGGKDLGTAVLKAGLANARYDSLDGYDRHPNQDEYRAISNSTEHVCATSAAEEKPEPAETSDPAESDDASAAGEASKPWNQPGPDLNCSDIQQKVQITGTDYHRLDRDGDGWACESYG